MFAGPLGRSTFTPPKSSFDSPLYGLVSLRRSHFFRFLDRATARGIKVPILAGIMPILSVRQIKRFTQMCGATIPAGLLSKIEAVEDDPGAVRQLGAYHATEQCESLLAGGAAGLHFYTLNRSTATRVIFQQIKGILAPTLAAVE